MIALDCLTVADLGQVWVAVRADKLVGILIGRDQAQAEKELAAYLAPAKFELAGAAVSPFLIEIEQYFAGERRQFELPIDWSLFAPFQTDVLKIVCAIQYGTTRTYGEIAKQLNKPNSARAVGRANATNPIPIVIPCHRVIGSHGKLHGYNAPRGVATKSWLLHLEGAPHSYQLSLL